MHSTPGRFRNVTGWKVWRIPRRLLVTVITVEIAALALVVSDVLRRSVPTGSAVATASLLCLAAVLHNEAALGVERIRRRSSESHHVDLNSVWTFAAAILLPPLMASAVVVVVYLYLYARVQRPLKMPAYRQLYSTATVVVAVHAAAAVIALIRPAQLYGTLAGTVTLALALLAYTVVNTALVLVVVAMANPEVKILRVVASGDEVTLELATLCMGALAATALSSATPLAVLLVIPPILVLHRTILLRQLEERADTDPKTGLLNAAAWHARSTQALRMADHEHLAAGLLILDLDNFKALNDRHGHLAGDDVLTAVANALRDEVRDHDLVGRFGGEEFVVLLPRLGGSTDHMEVRRIADRIRRRVRALRIEVSTADGPLPIGEVTVSVGGAVFPRDGETLTRLVETADSALFAAKRAGRDTVRTGPHLFPFAGPRDGGRGEVADARGVEGEVGDTGGRPGRHDTGRDDTRHPGPRRPDVPPRDADDTGAPPCTGT